MPPTRTCRWTTTLWSTPSTSRPTPAPCPRTGSLAFSRGGVDFPIHEQILAIQKIVLGQCLDAGVLARLQNQELQADPGTEPLRLAEVFRTLTDGIWSELKSPSAADEEKPQ